MKNETIVDRVVERIKQQPLGDLITEEDLHDIVKQAIPKAFFEPVVTRDRNGYAEKQNDPVIVSVMRELLKDAASAAVSKWIADNSELMAQTWAKVFDAGLLSYVEKMQDAKATDAVRNALRPWVDQENMRRSAQGLPPMYV